VLTAPTICIGGVTSWYRIDPTAPGGKVLVATGSAYRLTSADLGYRFYAVIVCPGGTSGVSTTTTDPVELYNPLNLSGDIVFTLANYTDVSPRIACPGGAGAGLVSFVGSVSTVYPTFTFTASSILGWASAGGEAYLQYTCSPPWSTDGKLLGIYVYLTAGSVAYRGPDTSLYGITNIAAFTTNIANGYRYQNVALISVTLNGTPVLTQTEPVRTVPPVVIP
jgi:hypothetical protein